MKYNRKIATVVFINKDGDVVFQDRLGHSKSGEKYGLWGGGIEEGETPLQAMKRELIEELNYKSGKLFFWKKYVYNVKRGIHTGWKILIYLYLAEITDNLLRSKVNEGAGLVKEKLVNVNPDDFGDSVENLWKELVEMYGNGQLKRVMKWQDP